MTGDDLPLPEPGRVAHYLAGDQVLIRGYYDPGGHYRLRSGKCSRVGMDADEIRAFLRSIGARFLNWNI